MASAADWPTGRVRKAHGDARDRRLSGRHGRRKEPGSIATNVVLLALAVPVAWARFGPRSF